MDFFGIGPMELLLILVVALIVFGPGKLPEIGAAMGRGVRELRKATTELTRDLTIQADKTGKPSGTTTGEPQASNSKGSKGEEGGV